MADEGLMERADREAREWYEARLHHTEHGTWLPRWECPTCTGETLPLTEDELLAARAECE